MATLVSFKEVSKRYGEAWALRGLDLSMEEGEFFAILGPSGSGKTTALRLLSGLEAPDEGEIELEGRLVSSPRSVLEPERRRIGMVFQSLALWPHMTVLENVEFPLRGQKQKARELLGQLGLEAVADRPPGRLSGGEQQRVALARAVAPSPRLLLLDEPFTGLEPGMRRELGGLVKDLARKLGLGVLYVTHLQEEALSLADRMAVLRAGRVEQVGAPEEVYDRPANAFVAAFVGDANILEGRMVRPGVAATLVGEVPIRREVRGDTLTLALRPEHLRVRSGGPIRGTVRQRRFKGGRVAYRLALEGGELTVELPERFAIGAELSLELVREPVVL